MLHHSQTNPLIIKAHDSKRNRVSVMERELDMEITESWEQKYSSPAEEQFPLEMSNQERNTSERI